MEANCLWIIEWADWSWNAFPPGSLFQKQGLVLVWFPGGGWARPTRGGLSSWLWIHSFGDFWNALFFFLLWPGTWNVKYPLNSYPGIYLLSFQIQYSLNFLFPFFYLYSRYFVSHCQSPTQGKFLCVREPSVCVELSSLLQSCDCCLRTSTWQPDTLPVPDCSLCSLLLFRCYFQMNLKTPLLPHPSGLLLNMWAN